MLFPYLAAKLQVLECWWNMKFPGTSWSKPATRRAPTQELELSHHLSFLRRQLNCELRDQGRCLSNLQRIEQSQLFHLISDMPKGCKLHGHFNSELPVAYYVDIAVINDRMLISSSLALANGAAFEEAVLDFCVDPSGVAKSVNIFKPDYIAGRWMLLSEFCEKYPQHREINAKEWIVSRLVTQQDTRTWDRFNKLTASTKKFIIEENFRNYLRTIIKRAVSEGVMYLEMRMMLMNNNIPSNKPQKSGFSLEKEMRTIQEEVQLAREMYTGEDGKLQFFGIKVILCSPRSAALDVIERELKVGLKLLIEFTDLICGFGLVGCEDLGNSNAFYKKKLEQFADACDEHQVHLRFMFHAGETLDPAPSQRDSNIYQALEFQPERLGHGIQIVKHPRLAVKARTATSKRNGRPVFFEICLVSNELLGLCDSVREHPYPKMLAAGLRCVLSSDNPAQFRETMTHNFVLAYIGWPKMTLFGLRQLAEWSIDASCLEEKEKEEARKDLEKQWKGWLERSLGKCAEWGSHQRSCNKLKKHGVEFTF